MQSKNLSTLCFLLLLLATIPSACNQPATAEKQNPPTDNQKNEEEAVKKLILSETDLFVAQNLEAWSACFVHQPYLTWTVTNGGEPGDVLTMRGWEALEGFMRAWFQENNAEFAKEMGKSKLTRDQWNIQIRGNTAFVAYDQRSENEEKQTKVSSTETRVCEKIDGAWKIAMQATLVDFKEATPPIRTKY